MATVTLDRDQREAIRHEIRLIFTQCSALDALSGLELVAAGGA